MAKRHHASAKDRLAESRGMEHYEMREHEARTHHNPHGKYVKMMEPDSEYAYERKDAGMIGNDHSKFANLPTEVMMKEYPACPAYMDWEMEDNINGIDRQLSNDNARRRSGFSPHKY